jgi:hypothetical protein
MERRNRKTTKWILQKKMDNEPLAADLDQDASVRYCKPVLKMLL